MWLLAMEASAHGWMTRPVSKNELSANRNWQSGMPGDFRYEPQSSANGNGYGSMATSPGASCGARSNVYAAGLGTWQTWYDGAGVPVPTLTPGAEVEVNYRVTADHGGQAWLMVACGGRIGEDVAWTYLERSPSDRGRHFMPSNPGIFAWRRGAYSSSTWKARFVVPSSFACPAGVGVGRLLWKTANSCLDVNNVGRKTETFSRAEYEAAIGGRALSTCSIPPEAFISCFDFRTAQGPGPLPTPAPVPLPTPAPTPVPTFAPTPAPPVGSCVRNTDCDANAWCNSPGFDTWCPQQPNCPAPQCVRASSRQSLLRMRQVQQHGQ